MKEPSNYPPGVTGNEPQITGESDPGPNLTDVRYALRQLRAIPLGGRTPRTNDHVQRAIDALERIEDRLVEGVE